MRAAILTLFAGTMLAADPAVIEKGRVEAKRACLGCHGLRIVESQRLSRGTWDRELTKMAGWGSAIKDREALLEYLVASYGDDKPIPAPVLTGDGVNK